MRREYFFTIKDDTILKILMVFILSKIVHLYQLNGPRWQLIEFYKQIKETKGG